MKKVLLLAFLAVGMTTYAQKVDVKTVEMKTVEIKRKQLKSSMLKSTMVVSSWMRITTGRCTCM